MPQIFQVLRCYKCLVFQVHQTKKSNKWECKMCGEKQSIKRHYGIGTGKDCRLHVQKLNSMRGEKDELKCIQLQHNRENEEEDEYEDVKSQEVACQLKIVSSSKWKDYVEEPEPVKETINEPMYFGDREVCLEIPKKRKKQFQNYSRKKSYTSPESTDNDEKGESYLNKEIDKPSYATPSLEVPTQSNFILETSKPLVIKEYESPHSVIESIEKENCKPNVIIGGIIGGKRKFVPPIINKNSKWAQYTEDEPEIAYTPNIDTSQNSQSDLLFSLCDDNELDDVLDI